ncbi:MAG: hypothetical protein MRY81_25515 [Donghicola eburneus]|nr:hypothetical protein [Donghicola eburneus]MCI5043009.1 hypothetical protein [Donghicola eburneus]
MSSKKPTWRDVKQTLKQYEKDQLIGLIQDLHKLNSVNADFLNVRLLGCTSAPAALSPYKKRIKQAVSPTQPWKQDVQLSSGRKAISDFKKASSDLHGRLTLMVYYIQCGNDFTLEFGDIDEGFYNSMCSMLDQVKNLLVTSGDTELAKAFIPVLEHELSRIDGQMGWGYPDEFADQIAELHDHFPTKDVNR